MQWPERLYNVYLTRWPTGAWYSIQNCDILVWSNEMLESLKLSGWKNDPTSCCTFPQPTRWPPWGATPSPNHRPAFCVTSFAFLRTSSTSRNQTCLWYLKIHQSSAKSIYDILNHRGSLYVTWFLRRRSWILIRHVRNINLPRHLLVANKCFFSF